MRELERAQRPGLERRPDEPPTPTDFDDKELPRAVRAELRSLPKDLAAIVGAHLLAAGELIDEDPELALAHAHAARRRAARLPVVREATAEAAYAAGDWQVALGEYRALHRMNGDDAYLPVMADCERALGRPREALKLAQRARSAHLDPEQAAEMVLVEAGAREDLGQAAEGMRILRQWLNQPNLPRVSRARLSYALAELMVKAGDQASARQLFEQADRLDDDHELDADDRSFELGGHVVDRSGQGEGIEYLGSVEDDDEDAPTLDRESDHGRHRDEAPSDEHDVEAAASDDDHPVARHESADHDVEADSDGRGDSTVSPTDEAVAPGGAEGDEAAGGDVNGDDVAGDGVNGDDVAGDHPAADDAAAGDDAGEARPDEGPTPRSWGKAENSVER